MTVIAYRDGVLAADSLICDGNLRVGVGSKLKQSKDGYVFGFAGSCAQVQRLFAFIDSVDDAAGANVVKFEDPQEVQFPAVPDIDGIMIAPGGEVYFIDPDAHTVIPFSADFAACGSGGSVAMGAMAAGACATDAVSAAIALCIDCGGDVVSISRKPKSVRKG